jgi:Golgi apparatus protein 1
MKRAFEASLSLALLESQVARVEARTGVSLMARDGRGRPEGITLTGWSALAGIAALVVTLLAAATYAWRGYTGASDPSTVVLKARHTGGGYKSVSTSAF